MPERCTYPALELSLVDGGIDPGEAPVANALVSFSAWDTNRAGAAGLAWSLVSVLHSARMEALDGTVTLLGARVVTGPIFRPDPDKFARYVTDAAVSVRVPLSAPRGQTGAHHGNTRSGQGGAGPHLRRADRYDGTHRRVVDASVRGLGGDRLHRGRLDVHHRDHLRGRDGRRGARPDPGAPDRPGHHVRVPDGRDQRDELVDRDERRHHRQPDRRLRHVRTARPRGRAAPHGVLELRRQRGTAPAAPGGVDRGDRGATHARLPTRR